MTIGSVNEWLSAISLLGTMVNGLWFWLSRPARDTNKRLDATNKRVEELASEANARADRHREDLKAHDRRIQRVEDDMRHLPTKDDLAELSHELVGVKTELGIVAKTVARIDDFLRKQP